MRESAVVFPEDSTPGRKGLYFLSQSRIGLGVLGDVWLACVQAKADGQTDRALGPSIAHRQNPGNIAKSLTLPR